MGHKQFHQEVGELRETLLRHRFIAPVSSDDFSEDALVRLLKCSMTLSASSSLEYRQTAYQIATAAAEMSGQFPGVRYALLLVLSRLGNFPALAYARRRFEVAETGLPVRSYAETSDRADANTIRLAERDVALTDFQFELWARLTSGENVGVSAPTSPESRLFFRPTRRKSCLRAKLGMLRFWFRRVRLSIKYPTMCPRGSSRRAWKLNL